MRTKKKLLQLVKIKPSAFILYGVVIFAWSCMNIYSAICLQKLFDAFEAMNQVSKDIYIIAVILVLIYACRGLTSFLVAALESWIGFLVDRYLKASMMDRIFHSYGAKFSKISTGEIINTFRNDIGEIKTFLLLITEEFAVSIYFFAMITLLFRINSTILLAVLAIAVLSVCLVRAGFRKLSECQKKAREIDGIFNGFAGEVLNCIFAVKMAGEENSVLDYFAEIGRKREGINIKYNVLRQLLSSVNQFSFEIGEGLVLLLAFQMIREGSFSIGDFALFTFLFDNISNVINATAHVVSEIPQAKVALQRIETVVSSYGVNNPDEIYWMKEQEREKQDKGIRPIQLIEIRNIAICADDGHKIIDNASFRIKKETITVIAGKTASGKTMLLRAVLGLYPILHGVIYWNNREIDGAETGLIPPIAAYTPQEPRFFSESIRDNILMGRTEDDKLERGIRLGILEEDVSMIEKGIDMVLGTRGTKMSGGQKKRLALSRMYAREAEVYAIDDVSSALDIETEEKVWDMIKSQKEKTFLIVSNSKLALEIADQILFLKDGKIEQYRNFEDALEKSEYISQMLGKYC